MDAPTIIADGYVITCDPQDHGGRMSILIRDGQIADLSLESRVLMDLHPEATVLDARRMLIVPGLVNAHFHPDSLLFHDIQKPLALWKRDTGMTERAARIADPAFQENLILLYTHAAALHLSGGVTTVSQTLPPVDGRLLGSLLGIGAANGLRTVTVLSSWEQIAEARRGTESGQPMTVSLKNEEALTVYSLDTLIRAARELNIPLHAGLAEVRDDAEAIRRNFKKDPLALLRDFKILDPSLHLVHLNHGNAEDVRLAAEQGATITLSLRSAAVKRTGYPLLRHLRGQPVQLCLGTDWGETDILREMTFLSELPLLFAGVPSYSPLDLLRMATINGARALGFGAETGSIERGKAADLILFGLRPAHRQYLSDAPSSAELAAMLLSQLNRSDIAAVMVRGSTVCENGRCTLLDEEEIAGRFRRLYASLAGTYVQGDPPAAARGRIIPFVASGPSRPGELEEFEEGFTVVEPPGAPEESTPGAEGPGEDASAGGAPAEGREAPSNPAGSPANAPPQAPPPPGTREVRKPELSKNVRRVFGDDDDPIQ